MNDPAGWGYPGISINCLKTILTPCQLPVASHDWGGWQGVRTDAQAFLEIPIRQGGGSLRLHAGGARRGGEGIPALPAPGQEKGLDR